MDEAIALLIKSQAEQIRLLTEANTRQNEQMSALQQRVDQLLAQIAWFTRQYFGRKSENLAHLDPNQLSLFESRIEEQQRLEAIEAAREKAETQIIESTQIR